MAKAQAKTTRPRKQAPHRSRHSARAGDPRPHRGRARVARRAAGCPTSCSRPASICAWARRPIGCARASCPVRAERSPPSWRTCRCTPSICGQGAVLETGCVYRRAAAGELALPAALAAATNPKSSTGRLDVFTRVIADGVAAFDQIPAGYQGPALCRDLPADLPGRRAQGLAASRRSAFAAARPMPATGPRRTQPAREAGVGRAAPTSTPASRCRST